MVPGTANAGHPGALFALTLTFDNGEGVTRDIDPALTFYRDEAVLGHGGVRASLGAFFHKGKGVPQDRAPASH